MTPASRRPRFEPLRSATPPSGAQNAHHSIEQVVQFSMSPPVQFRMSFDKCAGRYLFSRSGGIDGEERLTGFAARPMQFQRGHGRFLFALRKTKQKARQTSRKRLI